MLLTNYAISNAGQARALGGNLDPTYNFNPSKMNTMYAQDSSSFAPFVTNIVPNGDMEIAPFNGGVANTTAHAWVAGRNSVGVPEDSRFGWWYTIWGGTKAAIFDSTTKYSGSYSLKLSTLATLSQIHVQNMGDYGFGNKVNRIAVLPSTAYTISARIKTSITSGSATNGARFIYATYQSDDSSGAGNGTIANITTTSDWTLYTANITTGASAAFIRLQLSITNDNGTGSLIMDAWFDDISVTLTNQVTRAKTDNNNQYASHPSFGLQPPHALGLPPKAGGMSMYSEGDGVIAGTGVQGMFTTADLAGIGTITNAAMGLTVEMIATLAGTGSITASVIGALEASATLSGSGTLTAGIGALAGMMATLLGSGTMTASQAALGLMEAAIYVNQSQATVDQIVDGVVDGIGSVTATIPNLLNTETGDLIIPLD